MGTLATRLRQLEQRLHDTRTTTPTFEIWVAAGSGAYRNQATGKTVTAAELEERGVFTIRIDRASAPALLGGDDA